MACRRWSTVDLSAAVGAIVAGRLLTVKRTKLSALRYCSLGTQILSKFSNRLQATTLPSSSCRSVLSSNAPNLPPNLPSSLNSTASATESPNVTVLRLPISPKYSAKFSIARVG
uniref:(northern house mosquito) hypothetical protein n=1 Tax=Culex pipiens TaxID=7175 RepID=A0A8D8N0S1_CULPI